MVIMPDVPQFWVFTHFPHAIMPNHKSAGYTMASGPRRQSGARSSAGRTSPGIDYTTDAKLAQ